MYHDCHLNTSVSLFQETVSSTTVSWLPHSHPATLLTCSPPCNCPFYSNWPACKTGLLCSITNPGSKGSTQGPAPGMLTHMVFKRKNTAWLRKGTILFQSVSLIHLFQCFLVRWELPLQAQKKEQHSFFSVVQITLMWRKKQAWFYFPSLLQVCQRGSQFLSWLHWGGHSGNCRDTTLTVHSSSIINVINVLSAWRWSPALWQVFNYLLAREIFQGFFSTNSSELPYKKNIFS